MSNPFKENTTSYNDWEVLKDLEWHCTKCELKSGQAKTWQVWRQSGIQLAKDEKDNFYKMQFCKTCDMKTVHRKLESLKILDDTKIAYAKYCVTTDGVCVPEKEITKTNNK